MPQSSNMLNEVQPLANTVIPPELLCYIFSLSLPTRTPTSPIVLVIGSNAWRDPWILGGPWIFGQVCSYWRQLAQSLPPTLWIGITISTVLTTHEATLLHMQLARTANAPLDLLIRFTSGQRSHRETPFDRFLSTLVLHSTRWRTLHMEFDDACDPHSAFGALRPDSLPLLEELVLTGRGVPYLRKYDFFHDAPGLRRVVFGDCGVSTVANVPLPYGQLTTYKAIYPDVSTRLRVLSAASNLVECDIDFGPIGPAPYRALATNTVVTLPCLRRHLPCRVPGFSRRASAPCSTRSRSGRACPSILTSLWSYCNTRRAHPRRVHCPRAGYPCHPAADSRTHRPRARSAHPTRGYRHGARTHRHSVHLPPPRIAVLGRFRRRP
ncbi:hypothetical protein DFH06DRAFT_1179903 [Mycena polygramma]|nr:hypothetical protein DFH06DRAFT_1179903 [Mycena polygramma]